MKYTLYMRVRPYHIIGLCTFVAYSLTSYTRYVSQYNAWRMTRDDMKANFTSMLNRTQRIIESDVQLTVQKLRRIDSMLLDALSIIKIE